MACTCGPAADNGLECTEEQLSSKSRLPEGFSFAGRLLKTGNKQPPGEGLRERLVTLNVNEINYRRDEREPVLHKILMQEIVGVVMLQGGQIHPFWRAQKHENCISLVKGVPLTKHDFVVVCAPEGLYQGRVYFFRAQDVQTMEQWVELISRVIVTFSESPLLRVSRLMRWRHLTRKYYMNNATQASISILIMSNFAVNIAETCIKNHSAEQTAIFSDFDTFFTICWTFELSVNMFATLVWDFFRDPWNWFDSLVVGTSLVSALFSTLPGGAQLRLMRCFRVFRLFKRIPSLRRITAALLQSIRPVLNAFALVCLVTALYAIVGAEFFQKREPKLFGSFFISFFTLFQAMTGDNWSEHCRDLMADKGEPVYVALFYVTYMLIVFLVLVNVVIAVLLDEFAKCGDLDVAGIDQIVDDGKTVELCHFRLIISQLMLLQGNDEILYTAHELFDKIIKRGGMVDQGARNGHQQDRYTRALTYRTFQLWRHGGLDGWTLEHQEFARGFKELDFTPPIVVDDRVWRENVVSAGFAELRNGKWRIDRHGFWKLIKAEMRRQSMVMISDIIRRNDLSWDTSTIAGLSAGTAALLRSRVNPRRGQHFSKAPMAAHKSSKTTDLVDNQLMQLLSKVHMIESRMAQVQRIAGLSTDAGSQMGKDDVQSMHEQALFPSNVDLGRSHATREPLLASHWPSSGSDGSRPTRLKVGMI